MKKKYLNTILVLSILLIWGYIIKEVFIPVEPELFQHTTIENKNQTRGVDSAINYELLANYPDPFRVKNYSTSRSRKPQSTTKPKIGHRKTTKKITKERVLWPSIQYKGRIKNHTTQENIAVLKLNGQGYRLSENEIIKEVQVSSVWKDSILVFYQGEQKTIHLE